MGLLLLGIAIGIGAMVLVSVIRFPFVGTLLARYIPGEDPYLFLDLDKDVRYILSKKYVIMKISHE